MSFRIGQDIAALRGISATQKLVMYQLASYANDSTCECWPSQATLADYCSLTRKAVNQAIKALIAMGLVTVVEWHGKAIRYRLNVPSTTRATRDMSSPESCENIPPKKPGTPKSPVTHGYTTNQCTTLPPVTHGYTIMSPTVTQTEKKNREINNIKNNSRNINRQDTLEQEVTPPKRVLSVEGASVKRERFKIYLSVIHDFQEGGMCGKECRVRLRGVETEYIRMTEEAEARGWRTENGEPINNHTAWCKGLLRNLMIEYKGFSLSAEEVLDVVKEHYRTCFKAEPDSALDISIRWKTSPVSATARMIQETWENGWGKWGSEGDDVKPIADPIAWSKKAFEEQMREIRDVDLENKGFRQFRIPLEA